VTFLSPLLLLALLLLPILWWLLRATPPAPQRVVFPPLELLRGLIAHQTTPEHTPWWLLLLRLVAAGLLIIALAHPLYDPARQVEAKDDALLLVIDDGWAAARHWSSHIREAEQALDSLEREGRSLVLATTAPDSDGRIPEPRPLSVTKAREILRSLTPKPWPGVRKLAAEKLAALPNEAAKSVLWLGDGMEDEGELFAKTLSGFGPVEAIWPKGEELSRALIALKGESLTIRRAIAQGNEAVVIRALDAKGNVLGRERIIISSGKQTAEARIELPIEALARVLRYDVEGETGAASVYLRDETMGRRRVGLVAGNAAEDRTPLTGELYYVEKALSPKAELLFGSPDELLDREVGVLILSDGVGLEASLRLRIESWMRQGGALIRFAGPRLKIGADELMPVRLRGGGRMLGGTLTWSKPAALGPFPEHSPLSGLAIPPEVRVNSQALAEPEPGLSNKVWAVLEDGTPLVTAERREKGYLVLIHTSSNGEWSNLAMSGLFPEILGRLIELGRGEGSGPEANSLLPPYRLLDGLGRLGGPDGVSPLAKAALSEGKIGPERRPGLYGPEGARQGLNLGPSLGEFVPIPEGLPGIELRQAEAKPTSLNLQPPLLLLVFVLLLSDFLIALGLRGAFAAAMLAFCLSSVSLSAEEAYPAHLAYIHTGDTELDRTSESGLANLTEIIMRRTNVELGSPQGVSPERLNSKLIPLLYWAPSSRQSPLTPAGQKSLVEYMRHGGMLIIDLRDNEGALLPRLTEGMSLPPLAMVSSEHPLGRSFYLLGDFPGRRAGGALWVEPTEPARNDGVASLIVGNGDWAAAWAADSLGKPLFPILQGGEAQRERAFRFGVNLIIYALTGNYKTDQIHLPAIMDRLKR
jgi:hypothetical protein